MNLHICTELQNLKAIEPTPNFSGILLLIFPLCSILYKGRHV